MQSQLTFKHEIASSGYALLAMTFGISIFFSREMRFAVFDDEEEMHADQTSQRGRNHPNMRREEALKCERAQVWSAAQGFEDKFAKEGDTACDLGTNCRRPVCTLIPRKQISGETHANRGEQKSNADEPCQFARIFIRCCDKHAQHMNE